MEAITSYQSRCLGSGTEFRKLKNHLPVLLQTSVWIHNYLFHSLLFLEQWQFPFSHFYYHYFADFNWWRHWWMFFSADDVDKATYMAFTIFPKYCFFRREDRLTTSHVEHRLLNHQEFYTEPWACALEGIYNQTANFRFLSKRCTTPWWKSIPISHVLVTVVVFVVPVTELSSTSYLVKAFSFYHFHLGKKAKSRAQALWISEQCTEEQ